MTIIVLYFYFKYSAFQVEDSTGLCYSCGHCVATSLYINVGTKRWA